jgi:hypothetical protein
MPALHEGRIAADWFRGGFKVLIMLQAVLLQTCGASLLG